MQAAQTQQSNQLARVEKAGKTNEVVAKAFVDKETKLASATELKAAGEKSVAELQEKLSKLTNNVVAEAKQAEANAEKATATDTSANVASATNAPNPKLVAEVKEKLKDATAKVASASTTLMTAEKEFKKEVTG